MKKYVFKSMLLGALALTAACSDNVYDEPVVEDYSKDFIKEIGLINPQQNWNMAEQKSVTVDPGTATEVKIYAESGIVHKLVGHYKNLTGGKQVLTFDAAKSVNSFVVAINGRAQRVENGGIVDFNNVLTRTYVSESSDVHTVLTDYKEFTIDEVKSFLTQVPEQTDNTGNNSVHGDFLALSEASRSVTVYPIYWNAGYTHELGLYTLNTDGTIAAEYTIYRSKEGTDLQVDYGDGWETPEWNGANTSDEIAINNDNTKVQRLQSKGFNVTVPDGVTYGFFIKVYTGSMSGGNSGGRRPNQSGSSSSSSTASYTWYSEKARNTDGWQHAAFFQTILEDGTTRTFLGFEDCAMDGSDRYCDFDLNDLMIIFDPAPLVIDHSVEKWILAAEDLGNTDDYDFNDVVVEVERVAGTTTANVTALAAGATLPVYLLHDGEVIGGKEFHQWFGDYEAVDGKYPMINTYSAGKRGETYPIEVGDNFTMASFIHDINQMGGFTIQVGDVATAATTSVTYITPPRNGEVPQMMCVTEDYQWPYERTRITEAYPGFGEWGSNWTNSAWIKSPTDGKTLTNTAN